MQNKLVIFDLDGTLLHTLPDIADKVNQTLEKFGYKTLTEQEIKQNIGNGSRYLIQNSVGEQLSTERFEEVYNFFMTLYSKNRDPKTRLFDGVTQTLKTLIDRGYMLAIMTNKPQSATDKICGELLSHIPFSKIIGQSGTVKCKPDKTATINLLNELDVLPQNAYFVGDGETDVLTAKNAGINAISVLWGYRTKAQLESVGAEIFASTPLDLLSLISL